MHRLRSALLLLLGLVVALAGTVVPASSGTAAAALGSISGQMLVTGGAPIAGAEVTLYAEDSGDWYDDDVVETDATGSYRFTGVEAGAYRLRFLDPTGDHVTEYWGNGGTMDTADTLVLGAGENRTGVSVMVTRAGHVTGTVTGDGAALADVQVQAYEFSYAPGGWVWKPLAETWTDADGDYDLGGLSAGTYRLGFSDDGGVYLPEFWDDAATVTAAQDVVVREDQVTAGKDAQLERGGEITGTVTGVDGPLADVAVTVYTATDDPDEDWDGDGWGEYTYATTEADGTYSVGGLPTDSYRLGFRDYVNGHLTEYWDDAATLDSATAIPVVAGEVVAGKDAALAEGGRVSGVVRGAGGTALREGWVLALKADASDEWDYAAEAEVGADGAYELRGLATGDYVLWFYDFSGDHVPEYWDDAVRLEDATPVTVTAGQVVTGRDAELARAAEIAGAVSGPTAVDWVWVSALEKVDGQWEYAGGSYVETDGTYSVRGLAGGTYRLAFEDDYGRLVTEFWNDKPTLALADDITVAAGGTSKGHDAVLALPQSQTPTPPAAPVPAPTAPVPAQTAPATPALPEQLAALAKGLKVKGKPVVGKTVKVTNTVTDLRTRVRYSFQWYAGSKKIKKATKSSLKVTRKLKGKALKVKVELAAGGATKVVTFKLGKVR